MYSRYGSISSLKVIMFPDCVPNRFDDLPRTRGAKFGKFHPKRLLVVTKKIGAGHSVTFGLGGLHDGAANEQLAHRLVSGVADACVAVLDHRQQRLFDRELPR